jgi:very-short-patch-repair endonuclease
MRQAPSGACGRACGASRSRGFRFRRQVILGGFIADFACFDTRLAVEVDRATHATDEQFGRDAARLAALAAQGYDVFRVTNDDVFHNLGGVLETIHIRLTAFETAQR